MRLLELEREPKRLVIRLHTSCGARFGKENMVLVLYGVVVYTESIDVVDFASQATTRLNFANFAYPLI